MNDVPRTEPSHPGLVRRWWTEDGPPAAVSMRRFPPSLEPAPPRPVIAARAIEMLMELE